MAQAGPLSSTPPTQVSEEQFAPENTDILLSQAVLHNDAVIICPLPATTYQTPGCDCIVPQVNPSPVPLFVAPIVVPLVLEPHIIDVALHTKSFDGGGAEQLVQVIVDTPQKKSCPHELFVL